jgi:hypothetical protein
VTIEIGRSASGSAVSQFDRYYVDGQNGNDTTGDGSISKPTKTIQTCLNLLGQPTSHIDAMRTTHIYVSGKLSATAGYSPQTFDGCYQENLTVPNRRITIIGYGVKLGDNGDGTGMGNILKEYSPSRRFGATSSEMRPCLTLVGLANARDSHQRLRNGFHVAGSCRTSILARSFDSIQGNGTNRITVHIASGQFTYPITVTANYPTEPYIRIAVSGTTNYNGTYDITGSVDGSTFVATRVSGTNAATAVETSGSFFESDSAGASGITHDACFINTYMQGHYTCDDGTVNAAAPTAGTEVLYSIGAKYFTGVTGRGILFQRWEDTSLSAVGVTAGNFVIGATYTITAVGSTNFTLIGAASNTVGVVFTATGVGSGTGTATLNNQISSIAGMFDCSISGPLTVANFTYSTDDMGFMSCRFNAAMVFTVGSSGQTVRMDATTYASFLKNGCTWATNTPTVDVARNMAGVNLTAQTATKSVTTLFTPPVASFYRVSVYCSCTTAGTAGTVIPALIWKDASGVSQTVSLPAVNLNTLGSYSQQSVVMKCQAGQVAQYSATVAGATGSPQYDLMISVEPIL